MKKWEHFTKEQLQKMANESRSYRELAAKIGYAPDGGSSILNVKEMIEELNLNIEHFKGKGWSQGLTKDDSSSIKSREMYNIEDIFIANSFVARKIIRGYILRHNLIEYKCSFCGNTGEWLGKTISLELDHINGINNDNRLENLRWLCPNCHAITDTYCGKNIGKQKQEPQKKKKKDENAPKKEAQKICPVCQINKINSRSSMCVECSHKQSRVVERPSREELKQLIRTTPFLQIGKMYGVSDNAIRKWCDAENLPRKSTEIKKYTDEEWANI